MTMGGNRLQAMRINAPKGQQVVCLDLRDDVLGRGASSGLLAPGAVYTVMKTEVFKDHSLVILAEVPGATFNTVLFQEVGDILDAEDSPADLYFRGLEERRRPFRRRP